jgi:hypothetical protein
VREEWSGRGWWCVGVLLGGWKWKTEMSLHEGCGGLGELVVVPWGSWCLLGRGWHACIRRAVAGGWGKAIVTLPHEQCVVAFCLVVGGWR